MGRNLFRTGRVVIDEPPSVNLTPLIDVVFVILIMFILVAPVIEMEKIELANGGPNLNNKNISVTESGAITIHVDRNGLITMNQNPVNFDRLIEVLREAKRIHPTATPQIFHDKRASFGTYQSVKNSVEAAGFETLDIVLVPQG